MFDLLVKGGRVVDGTGARSQLADVGIRDGHIVEIGSLSEPGRRTIDADGRAVTPGFIDVHTHLDRRWGPSRHAGDLQLHDRSAGRGGAQAPAHPVGGGHPPHDRCPRPPVRPTGPRSTVRGRAYADVVVLDEDAVGTQAVVTRFDLPGGAGRLSSEATGVDHVVVNGVEICRDGAFTEARPGTLLRSGRDTYTASLD